jgi:hypothetical protein
MPSWWNRAASSRANGTEPRRVFAPVKKELRQAPARSYGFRSEREELAVSLFGFVQTAGVVQRAGQSGQHLGVLPREALLCLTQNRKSWLGLVELRMGLGDRNHQVRRLWESLLRVQQYAQALLLPVQGPESARHLPIGTLLISVPCQQLLIHGKGELRLAALLIVNAPELEG